MKFFILASLFYSVSILANEPLKGYQQIVCYNDAASKKITIQIAGVYPDKFEKTATVYISKDIETSPFQVITTTITNAKIDLINLDLIGTRDQFVTELQLNLGRSGNFLIKSQSNDGDSSITSSMREFFFLSEATMQCSHSFGLGPKPFSGGN